MRELSIDELKRIQLEILDFVAKFCTEHNINYGLGYGTLLGAVRHKGYIPWDDDIDLVMLRSDYDRFIREFNELTVGVYQFRCFENDPKYEFPFGKVYDTSTVLYEPDEKGVKLAVNMDIFPIDNAPDNDEMVNDMFKKRAYYGYQYCIRRIRVFDPVKGNLLRRLCAYAYRLAKKICFAFPSRYYYVRKMVDNSRRCISEDTKRVGDFTGPYSVVCSKEAFSSFVDLEFEGRKYKAPVGYDEWLRALYGDYMQLPPVEERQSRHRFKAYKL